MTITNGETHFWLNFGDHTVMFTYEELQELADKANQALMDYELEKKKNAPCEVLYPDRGDIASSYARSCAYYSHRM